MRRERKTTTRRFAEHNPARRIQRVPVLRGCTKSMRRPGAYVRRTYVVEFYVRGPDGYARDIKSTSEAASNAIWQKPVRGKYRQAGYLVEGKIMPRRAP